MDTTDILLGLVALLFGSMIFFAVIVAPSVFRFLPEQQAGLFLRGMFPRYYLWGIAISLVISAVAVFVETWMLVISILLLIMFVLARQVLMPAINDSRDLAKQGDDAAKKRFDALHSTSVIINATQMLILLVLIFYLL